MECVVVHDLFLNETANFAHVFLPGSTFLEKDGTFTNAERRIKRVRKVMRPAGKADWEVVCEICANAHGLSMGLRRTRPRSWTRSPRSDADVRGRLVRPARRRGVDPVAVSTTPRPTARRSCTSAVRARQGPVRPTEYVATTERTGPRFPLC
jgi:formate dehydrogenase major subunit